MIRGICDFFGGRETTKRLLRETRDNLKTTEQGIEEARCLMLKHQQNVAFYANKIEFLTANKVAAENTIHGVTNEQ